MDDEGKAHRRELFNAAVAEIAKELRVTPKEVLQAYCLVRSGAFARLAAWREADDFAGWRG